MREREEWIRLAGGVKDRDEVAGAQLYELLREELYGYILRKARHDDRLAEELFQQAVAEIFLGIYELADLEQFELWCVQIVRKTCEDYFTGSGKRHGAEEEEAVFFCESAEVPPVLPDTEAMAKKLDGMIGKLSGSEQTAIVLHYRDGCSVAQVAKQMGLSQLAVHRLLHKGRRNLQNMAERDSGTQLAISKVHFSAVAPRELVKGAYSMIDVVMYEESARQIVDELAAQAEEPVQETGSGMFSVEENARIRVVLTSADIPIDDGEETALWCGEYLRFRFAVSLPETFEKKQVLFQAAVYINGVIATKLKFIARCASPGEQKLKISREDVLSAFVSYASQDRRRVATLIQGMQKARPDMDIFFDVESLRSGEDWERALTAEIQRRDVLFLCWSTFARESRWVDTEWRYALQAKGVEAIEPIPIDPPEVCPPPEELQKKHFNDKLLYIINAGRDAPTGNSRPVHSNLPLP